MKVCRAPMLKALPAVTRLTVYRGLLLGLVEFFDLNEHFDWIDDFFEESLYKFFLSRGFEDFPQYFNM